MKKLLTAVFAAWVVMSVPAFAEDKPLTSQQQKMVDCNATAKSKELKGDERKVFMKECLSGDKAEKAEKAAPAADKAPSEKQAAQTEKMKSCNADAKEKTLKGDERKAFMKTCLSAG